MRKCTVAQCLQLVVLCVFIACATASASFASSDKNEIVSLKYDFEKFWKKAAGQSVDKQEELWNELIERPHQSFYDFAVWEKYLRPNWADTKKKTLVDRFKLYPSLCKPTMIAFDNFPETVKEQVRRFKRVVPTFELNFPVYAVVAPNFDAKSAITSSDTKSIALVLAVDTLVQESANYDILFPHELFHPYHALRSGFINDGVMPGTTLIVPLWEEGLATYISGLVNPSASDSQILLDDQFKTVSRSDIKWLAKKFLEQKDEKSVDSVPTNAFKRWFNVGKLKVRDDLPNRCGYFLGLYVVRELAKAHSLAEMISWSPKEIRPKVEQALNVLAH